MAVILEDEDLIAQAQERERARLEEEARILAFQQAQQAVLPPPVWTGSLGVAIDEFNAQPGMVSAPTTIGSEQYNQELARAQRGSGYVAADIGPMGNVITSGYDPTTDPRAIAAEQAATSFKRQQLYGQLLRDGATAAEAFRFAHSRFPDIRSAPGLMQAETAIARTRPFQPEIRDLGGVQMVRTGPQSWRPLTPPRAVPGRVTPAVQAQAQGLAQEASLVRRALSRGVKEGLVPLPYTDEEKAKLRDDLKRIESEQQRILSAPEVNPNVDQRGFAQMRPAWEAAGRAPMVTPPASIASAPAQVIVIKDGKRYGLPKSQLDEAIKAGYKLVE